MATRQNSTNGKPKSPRIQVVLPELICEQLNCLAENESRTVSNMAKVLIQEGIKNYFKREAKSQTTDTNTSLFSLLKDSEWLNFFFFLSIVDI